MLSLKHCGTTVRLTAVPARACNGVRCHLTHSLKLVACPWLTLNQQRMGIMLHHKRLESVAGSCHVALSTLVAGIGSMAHSAGHHPQDFPPHACSALGDSSLRRTSAIRLVRREPMTARAGPVG